MSRDLICWRARPSSTTQRPPGPCRLIRGSNMGIHTLLSSAAPALLAAALTLSMMACSSHAESMTRHATPVRVQAAVSGPARPAIATNGIVATKDEMRLSFKVAGLIKRIYVEEGRSVRKGERLAEIELTE